jgi:hypothetical protein
LAAAIFFAGVLVGGRAFAPEARPPTPVVLVAAEPGSPRPTPSESPLEVEEVPRQVDEDPIEEYEDEGDDDSSGPGSGDETDDDNSGPGSGDSSGPGSGDEVEEPDQDTSGPGSGDDD